MEIIEDGYIFTDNLERIKLDEVCRLLKQSHWANSRPSEIIKKSIDESSLCFSIYHNNNQIGFARVISDYAVYSLISDVIIDEKYRGNGLGTKFINFISDYPSIKNTSKVIWTRYAENLYQRCGFSKEGWYKLMFNRS